MKIDFKDYLIWVRIFVGIIILIMYVSSIQTLKPWSWGFWSFEYLATIVILVVYIWWDNMTTTNRRLYRIENKLDANLGANDE